MVIQLAPEYELETVDQEVFQPIFKEHMAAHFHKDRDLYMPQSLLAPVEKEKLQALQNRFSKSTLVQLQYLLYKVTGSVRELAGWTWGIQIDGGTFYMANSVVFPEHRRQGLYSKMVAQIVSDAEELGFLKIKSLHVASNNPVIIAKLRMGFFIQGVEQDERYGTLVKLIYYTKDHGKRVFEFRTGSRSFACLSEGDLNSTQGSKNQQAQ